MVIATTVSKRLKNTVASTAHLFFTLHAHLPAAQHSSRAPAWTRNSATSPTGVLQHCSMVLTMAATNAPGSATAAMAVTVVCHLDVAGRIDGGGRFARETWPKKQLLWNKRLSSRLEESITSLVVSSPLRRSQSIATITTEDWRMQRRRKHAFPNNNQQGVGLGFDGNTLTLIRPTLRHLAVKP